MGWGGGGNEESKKLKAQKAEQKMVTRLWEWGKWGDIGQRLQSCSYME